MEEGWPTGCCTVPEKQRGRRRRWWRIQSAVTFPNPQQWFLVTLTAALQGISHTNVLILAKSKRIYRLLSLIQVEGIQDITLLSVLWFRCSSENCVLRPVCPRHGECGARGKLPCSCQTCHHGALPGEGLHLEMGGETMEPGTFHRRWRSGELQEDYSLNQLIENTNHLNQFLAGKVNHYLLPASQVSGFSASRKTFGFYTFGKTRTNHVETLSLTHVSLYWCIYEPKEGFIH